MTLQSEEINSLVIYRSERALQALEEAKAVTEMGFWTLAVQRLYYAVYYAQCALLLKRGISASTHAGVIAIIGLHFVKEGLISPDENSLIGKLFSMRQTGDYGDIFSWSKKDVEPLISETETLVKNLLDLLDK